jgi:6-phosphogluconolactonase
MFKHLSRRDFLKYGSATALIESARSTSRGSEASAAPSPGSKMRAYVGTYTTAATDGHGEGIYLFDVDLRSAELTGRRLVAETPNPSWITIHPTRKYLYAINEVNDFAGGNGSVSAFAVDPDSGNLDRLNTVSSGGAGPAHMSLDRTGRFAFVANYAGGTIGVLPIAGDGRLGEAVDVHSDIGPTGAAHAADAPPGSFAISGHDKPHAHMIAPDPANRFVLATDLGLDRIYVYRFDASAGKLKPNGDPVLLPSGDGPRHFAFHPRRNWLYLLCEESSTIVFYGWDPESGALHFEQRISALGAGFAGTSFGSEIQVGPEGRFLYSANRLEDTISISAIGADGRLTRTGEVETWGDYPRHFAFDPDGQILFTCDQRSDAITSFRVAADSGGLRFTGRYAAVPSPAMIAFLHH